MAESRTGTAAAGRNLRPRPRPPQPPGARFVADRPAALGRRPDPVARGAAGLGGGPDLAGGGSELPRAIRHAGLDPHFGAAPADTWGLVSFVGMAVILFSGGLIAWAGARFFQDTRRQQDLELLLTTPLGGRNILTGQWRVLRRALAWPLGVVLALALPAGISLIYDFANGYQREFWFLLQPFLIAVNLALEAVALCWVGMWFGLRGRNAITAVAGTVGLVQLLPLVLAVALMWGWAWLPAHLVAPAHGAGQNAARRPGPAVLSWRRTWGSSCGRGCACVASCGWGGGRRGWTRQRTRFGSAHDRSPADLKGHIVQAGYTFEGRAGAPCARCYSGDTLKRSACFGERSVPRRFSFRQLA